ncbi:hypothetical protein POM88_044318 [Heracleum sosnowskyi]|uniref:Protein FAR1-RELATED SEQUENCE n=1 Tax=Heracleum sosnowskyi TaxID=360622 RepID=A0AAD8H3M5_9APIA|nr:hypothetical protein POM88_044318 [Heracleum sosnowskyi]
MVGMSHFVQKGETLSEFYLCFHSAIEKQMNANGLLNHKDDVTLMTIQENDASELYTRTMFHKIQEQITLSCGDMIMEDIWLKKAEERFSILKLSDIADINLGEEVKRAKTRDCWFEFQGCISDASTNIEYLNFIHKGLTVMRQHIKESRHPDNAHHGPSVIEDYIGTQVGEKITIQNPNQSNNKGKNNNKGSRKRIVVAAEKSLGGKKRQKRKCKSCDKLAYHDSRNCPKKS